MGQDHPTLRNTSLSHHFPASETASAVRHYGTAEFKFKVIRPNKVYEQVAKQIEQLIVNRLNPGDKLPPERELAEMFAVSRSSIRDATRVLEIFGLVESRQGVGTIVRERAASSVAPLLTGLLARQATNVASCWIFAR